MTEHQAPYGREVESSNQTVTEAIKIITDLISRRFYGKFIIQFENGKIVLFHKNETLKPGGTT